MTEQEDLASTLEQIQLSRYTLFHALAGYRYLANPHDVGEEFTVHLRGNEIAFQGFDGPGIGYSLTFQAHELDPWAERVVKQVAKQMVISTIDAAWGFALRNGRKEELGDAPPMLMARHMRNAYSHDGTWRLDARFRGPVVWNNRELRAAMHGKDPDDLISLVDKLQLCSMIVVLLTRGPGYEHGMAPTD